MMMKLSSHPMKLYHSLFLSCQQNWWYLMLWNSPWNSHWDWPYRLLFFFIVKRHQLLTPLVSRKTRKNTTPLLINPSDPRLETKPKQNLYRDAGDARNLKIKSHHFNSFSAECWFICLGLQNLLIPHPSLIACSITRYSLRPAKTVRLAFTFYPTNTIRLDYSKIYLIKKYQISKNNYI